MKQFFEVWRIPEILEFRPIPSGSLITREAVRAVMEHNPKAIFPVRGDCLERCQVMDGGWVCVDFTRCPAPPRVKSRGGDGSTDLCCCYAVFPGQRRPVVMLKAYDGVWGPWQMVSTRYDLSKGMHHMDCGMEAKEIFGVIIASWDSDGQLLWKREPESFPKELGTKPTIHGENIGDPISLDDDTAGKIERNLSYEQVAGFQ